MPIGLDRTFKLEQFKGKNHKGARDYPEQVKAYLSKEISEGACIGPFLANPFCLDCQISPINTVEKRDSPDRRVIVDLSFPKGSSSVNAAICMDRFAEDGGALSYPSVDALVDLVVKNGRGCALYKRDLKRAYRQLPVDMGDVHVLGYRWEGGMFFDLVLPMGLKSSAFCCQKVTNLIRHIQEDKGFDLVNFLDDFGGCEKWDLASEAFLSLGDTLQQAGLSDAVEKRVPPCTRMLFLGILLNTIEFSLSIDEVRLQEIAGLVDRWLGKFKCSRHDLESLLGKLKFVASCVRPGRIFTMRLLALLRKTPSKGFIQIPRETKADLKWWKRFLVTYNGVSMMPEYPWSEPDGEFSTDACLTGCGGWFNGSFFHSKFPAELLSQELHINSLELVAIMVAIRVWGPTLRGKRVTILCDNQSSVQVLNRGFTKDAHMAACLREIAYMAAIGEFAVRARHLAGVQNRIADLLSRWELVEGPMVALKKLAPNVKLCEIQVPLDYFQPQELW